MPKSRTRKRSTKGKPKSLDWGAASAKGSGRINLVLGAVALAAVVAGGLYLWQLQQAGSTFEALVAEGQPALARVETPADRGGGHLGPGQGHSYDTAFPTSGIHDRVPVDAGFYTGPRRATQLVHAIEHGNVVIYYDDPGAAWLDRQARGGRGVAGCGCAATPFPGGWWVMLPALVVLRRRGAGFSRVQRPSRRTSGLPQR